MTKEDDILVRIAGKTYRLDQDKPESLRKIPWSQRKRLITVLEAIKKAEYLDSANAHKDEDENPAQVRASKTSSVMTVQTNTLSQTSQQPAEKTYDKIDSSQDSDALMKQFLTEQQTHKRPIPTKSTIYKWFLIFFVIILLLVLVL